MRFLLVEDDLLIGDAVQTRLRDEQHSVEWVRNGRDASVAYATGGFDIVVLDLGLPGLDGLDVLVAARAAGDKTPTIALTARDTVDDRIAGLDRGADDYLVKPFDMDELIARCRALTRRSSGRTENRITIGDISLDTLAQSVEVAGAPISISPHEFQVLQCLLERIGRVVSKSQLAEVLYGWDDGAESNTIEVYVSQLRKKLGTSRIKTLRGIGYMLS